MRVLIAGLGSIGRRHLGNLRKVDSTAVPVVWRMRPGATDSPGDCQVVHSLAAALATRPDVALVTCPASLHVGVATDLALAGVHLLVEKPVSHHSDSVPELIEICRRDRVVLMVGYNFRFYPPLRALRDALLEGRIGRLLSLRAEVGQYLPDWRPSRDYRESTTARRDLGGGALLELSHEFDYIRWLAGEVTQVSAQVAKLSDLDIDVEDTVEMVCRFASGAVGSVHLDLTQRPGTRTCRLAGTNGALTWDRANHQVLLIRPDGAIETIYPGAPQPMVDMYQEELRHFLGAVRTNTAPLVTGDDGLRALLIAEAAARSSMEGRTVTI